MWSTRSPKSYLSQNQPITHPLDGFATTQPLHMDDFQDISPPSPTQPCNSWAYSSSPPTKDLPSAMQNDSWQSFNPGNFNQNAVSSVGQQLKNGQGTVQPENPGPMAIPEKHVLPEAVFDEMNNQRSASNSPKSHLSHNLPITHILFGTSHAQPLPTNGFSGIHFPPLMQHYTPWACPHIAPTMYQPPAMQNNLGQSFNPTYLNQNAVSSGAQQQRNVQGMVQLGKPQPMRIVEKHCSMKAAFEGIRNLRSRSASDPVSKRNSEHWNSYIPSYGSTSSIGCTSEQRTVEEDLMLEVDGGKGQSQVLREEIKENSPEMDVIVQNTESTIYIRDIDVDLSRDEIKEELLKNRASIAGDQIRMNSVETERNGSQKMEISANKHLDQV
ncbi:hypothetical protein JTB14_018237 [Gonioctena quinquepunctata]|nr:hypothetical protein JTB14_018237 [Gonioctena quinquepunctata]